MGTRKRFDAYRMREWIGIGIGWTTDIDYPLYVTIVLLCFAIGIGFGKARHD